MFIFLTRFGRLFVGTTVVVAVTSVLGFNTLTAVPVASHSSGHGGTSTTAASCVLNPATSGGQLVITGSGYKAGAKYAIDMTWPYGGSGYLFATADSSGNWTVYTYAYWPGTYNVSVLNGHGAILATCSETVS